MPPRKPPAQRNPRRDILSAAQACFVADGLHKTSMEAIAGAAGVAKATLYAYFPNKTAVFDAVCAALAEDMAVAAGRAAARASSPRAAVLASLTSKYTSVWTSIRASPHARELLDASLAASSPLTQELHERYVRDLSALLERAGSTRARAAELAEVYARAAEGITVRASSKAELARHLKLLVGG